MREHRVGFWRGQLSGRPPAEARDLALGRRRIVEALRWAAGATWATSPLLVVGAVALALARSTVAAGLAVSARGLINAAVAESQHESPQLASILPWLVAALAFGLIEVLAPMASTLAVRRLTEALQLRVTTEIFAHVSRLPPTEMQEPGRREMVDQARDASANRLGRLVSDLLTIVTDLVQCALLAGVLFHIEPLTLAIVVPGAVAYLYAEWRNTSLHHAGASIRVLRQRWIRHFADLLTGARSAGHVRLLGLTPTLIERFRDLAHELEAADRARARSQFVTGATFGILTTLLFCVLLALVTSRAIDGRLTVGDIAVFAAASPRLRSTLSRLILAITQVLDALLATEAIRKLLAVASSASPPSVTSPAPAAGGLEVEDVWFTYPGAIEPAVAGVSFRIPPGEMVALAGANGAGKSTLVKLLAGLYVPQKGRILLDGQDLREWPFEALRQRLVLVSPDSPRFEASARDNVAFGHWPELGAAPQAVEGVAAKGGVHPLLSGLPRGYDTTLGPLFGEHDLSSGQWQQLVLARALARPASLWLFDEPTAHLDERAERQFLDRLGALVPGRSILVASHRSGPLALAERIVVMEHGRIVEEGPRGDLLARDGTYARIVTARGR
jgi:ATP-binding cassette subfamily B protein